MSKKLKPSEDPAYFEWEPNEEAVSDEEICQSFFRRNTDPEDIGDPVFKKKYLAYIKMIKN